MEQQMKREYRSRASPAAAAPLQSGTNTASADLPPLPNKAFEGKRARQLTRDGPGVDESVEELPRDARKCDTWTRQRSLR